MSKGSQVSKVTLCVKILKWQSVSESVTKVRYKGARAAKNMLCRRQMRARMAPYGFSNRYPDCSTWQDNHKQEVLVEQHPLITRAHRGDLIRVMLYVEDRHRLQVQDCQMTLLHKNPLPEEEPSPTEEPLPTEETSPSESSLPVEGLKKFKSQ